VVTEWTTRRRRAEAALLAKPGTCPPARRIAMMMTTRHRLSRADALTIARIVAIPSKSCTRSESDPLFRADQHTLRLSVEFGTHGAEFGWAADLMLQQRLVGRDRN
jgi:predicted metal-binding protein